MTTTQLTEPAPRPAAETPKHASMTLAPALLGFFIVTLDVVVLTEEMGVHYGAPLEPAA